MQLDSLRDRGHKPISVRRLNQAQHSEVNKIQHNIKISHNTDPPKTHTKPKHNKLVPKPKHNTKMYSIKTINKLRGSTTNRNMQICFNGKILVH